MRKLTNLLFEGYNYKRINDINVDPNTQKMIVYHITGKQYNPSSWSTEVPRSEKPERYKGKDKAERSKNILDRLAYKAKKSKARFDRTLKGQTYNLADAISGGMYSSGNEFGVGGGKHHGPGLYTCYKFNPSIAKTYGGKLGASVLQFECSTENMLILNGQLCQMIRGRSMTIGEQMDRIIENKGLQLSPSVLEVYNDWKENVAARYDDKVLNDATKHKKPRSANIWQDIGRQFAAMFNNSLLGRDIVDSVLLDGAGDGPVVVLFDYKTPQLIRAGYIYNHRGKDAVKWYEDLGQLGSSRFRVPKKDLALAKEISETSEEDLERENLRQQKLEDFVSSDIGKLNTQQQIAQAKKLNTVIAQFQKSFEDVGNEYRQSYLNSRFSIDLSPEAFNEMCTKLIAHEVENEVSEFFTVFIKFLKEINEFRSYISTNVYTFNRLIGVDENRFFREMNGNIKVLPIVAKCMQTITAQQRNSSNKFDLSSLISIFYIDELAKYNMTLSFNRQQVEQNMGEISSLLVDYYDAPQKIERMIKSMSQLLTSVERTETKRSGTGGSPDPKFMNMFIDAFLSSIRIPDFNEHSKYSESVAVIRSEYEKLMIPRINSTNNIVINNLIAALDNDWSTRKSCGRKLLSDTETIFTQQEAFKDKNTDQLRRTISHFVNDQFDRNDHSSIYNMSCDFLYNIQPELEQKISFQFHNDTFYQLLLSIDEVFKTSVVSSAHYELAEFSCMIAYNEQDSNSISSLIKGLTINKIKEILIREKTLNYISFFEWSLEDFDAQNSPNPALAADIAESVHKIVNDSLTWSNNIDYDDVTYSCDGFDVKLLKDIQEVFAKWHPSNSTMGEL